VRKKRAFFRCHGREEGPLSDWGGKGASASKRPGLRKGAGGKGLPRKKKKVIASKRAVSSGKKRRKNQRSKNQKKSGPSEKKKKGKAAPTFSFTEKEKGLIRVTHDKKREVRASRKGREKKRIYLG